MPRYRLDPPFVPISFLFLSEINSSRPATSYRYSYVLGIPDIFLKWISFCCSLLYTGVPRDTTWRPPWLLWI